MYEYWYWYWYCTSIGIGIGERSVLVPTLLKYRHLCSLARHASTTRQPIQAIFPGNTWFEYLQI